MADWRGVSESLTQGYQVGRSTGGRFSVLGQKISEIADSLRNQRIAGEQASAEAQSKILGEIGAQKIKRMYNPESQAKADIAEKIKAGQTLSPEETKLFYGYEAKEKTLKPADLLGLISGIRSPESVLPKETIEQLSPVSLGSAESGQVLLPAGATTKDGEIISSTGERIGEFAPGREPQKRPELISGIIGKKLGVSEEEAKRKYLGLPLKKSPFTAGKIEQVKGALVAGKVFSGGMFVPLTTQQQKEEYAQSQLGPNWREYIGETTATSKKKLSKKEPEIITMDTDWE